MGINVNKKNFNAKHLTSVLDVVANKHGGPVAQLVRAEDYDFIGCKP